MANQTIGDVVSYAEALNSDKVNFRVPYGQTSYWIALSTPELNEVLATGVEKVLGNKALSGFDYDIRLPEFELPLFVGVRAIETAEAEGAQDITMRLGVVSQSIISENEHRGILEIMRPGWSGEWSFVDYTISPPLKDRNLEEVV